MAALTSENAPVDERVEALQDQIVKPNKPVCVSECVSLCVSESVCARACTLVCMDVGSLNQRFPKRMALSEKRAHPVAGIL